ncbi:MAG: alkane 1-monooxygenase [Oleibacter sp.]|nr:alkane 1-monooxygenase [Thalassolituus sp.]
MFQYLKYFIFHVIGLMAAASMYLGSDAIVYGLAVIFGGYIFLDAILGDDTTTPTYKHPWILTVQLWLALPLLSFILFSFLWQVSPGDMLGIGKLLTNLTGYDVLVAKTSSTILSMVCATIITGLMIGMVGTITAHELTHRTWDPVSMFVGRWLLAFSFDVAFAVEHVYGHHRYVSTTKDPATAPRGRNVYYHILSSTVRGNVSALKLESDRLKKLRKGVVSINNSVLRGYVMSAFIVMLAFVAGGVQGMLFFIAAGLIGKSLLEIVNYMEHYGMVRNPDTTPVQPRHSWNTNKRFSSWSMFNLTRHSHHHAHGNVPYQELRPYPEAPTMLNGYLATIVIAIIPPLWHKLMTPKVLEWDAKYASDEEKELAKIANAKSGISGLQYGINASERMPDPSS